MPLSRRTVESKGIALGKRSSCKSIFQTTLFRLFVSAALDRVDLVFDRCQLFRYVKRNAFCGIDLTPHFR